MELTFENGKTADGLLTDKSHGIIVIDLVKDTAVVMQESVSDENKNYSANIRRRCLNGILRTIILQVHTT